MDSTPPSTRIAVATMIGALSMGCAGTPATSDRLQAGTGDCVAIARVRDWRPLDNENLLLLGTNRAAYHVELMDPATRLTPGTTIGIDATGNRVCSNRGDAIVIADSITPDRIPIRSIRILDEAELAELYAQYGIAGAPPVEVEGVELDTTDTD